MSAVLAASPGLPGIELADRMPAARPLTLLAPGVLLLAGVEPGRPMDLAEHARRWGRLPFRSLAELVTSAREEEIVGAGGAGFPLERKLDSLTGARVSHVVVNGSEGETASGKDGVLLTHVPHLVLDGAVAAARALRAARVVVRVSADRPDLVASLTSALAQRSDGLATEVSVGPAAFVSGEATAVIRGIRGGPALPADLGRPPVLPGRSVIPGRRRPHVLLSNVETFARLAVALRGQPANSALLSASGAVNAAGVLELAQSRTLADVAALAGVVGRPRILITGGWHGRWIRWDAAARVTRLTPGDVADVGGRWGAGAFVWLGEDVPPMRALAAIAVELAEGTAGQCGPCWRGLPELAALIAAAGDGPRDRASIDQVMGLVDGRGICAHPTASVTALRSALDLIAELP